MNVVEIINEAIASGRTRFAFELLPPLKGDGMQKIFAAVEPLRALDPAYVNITFHREGIKETEREDGSVYAATQKTGSVAAHVTAISAQGVKRWEHAADGDINGVPAVDDQGFVYYNDRTTGKLVKLRPEDGSRVAEIKLADELRSSPTISYDGTIYVNGMKDDKPTVFAVKGAAEGCAASWSQQGGNPSKTEYMY